MKTFKEYRFENNPLEELFVKEFIKENKDYFDLEAIIFGYKNNSLITTNDTLSERERNIILTTIQWLGSPVGQGFLYNCGFIKK